MIKNIYDKVNNFYKHEYFCDYCFKEIGAGEILRNEEAIKRNKFDLCCECKNEWDEFEEINEERGKGELMNKCMICGTPTPMNKPLCYVCGGVYGG